MGSIDQNLENQNLKDTQKTFVQEKKSIITGTWGELEAERERDWLLTRIEVDNSSLRYCVIEQIKLEKGWIVIKVSV